jgi:hypothetical protein
MRGSLAGFFIIVYWEAVGNIIVYDGRCSHESIGLKEEFIRVLRNPKNFTQWYLRTRRIHQSSSRGSPSRNCRDFSDPLNKQFVIRRNTPPLALIFIMDA